MATVYEKILELCQQKGVTPGKMCNDLGYSRNTMTALKTGRSTTLKLDKSAKIATSVPSPTEAPIWSLI